MFDIAELAKEYAEKKVDILVIPPDLLTQLGKNGRYKDLIDKGNIRFSSLQYLSIKDPIVNSISCDEEELVIELENYVLLSPEALPLDEKNKAKLKTAIANDPLALIEYWSVDPNFDGETFRSKWQDYRENKSNSNEAYKVCRTAKLIIPTTDSRKRKVCVKAVDVFGFESVVVKEL